MGYGWWLVTVHIEPCVYCEGDTAHGSDLFANRKMLFDDLDPMYVCEECEANTLGVCTVCGIADMEEEILEFNDGTLCCEACCDYIFSEEEKRSLMLSWDMPVEVLSVPKRCM